VIFFKLAGVAKGKGVWPANDISHTHIPLFLREWESTKKFMLFFFFKN